jgi:hypothetical protein
MNWFRSTLFSFSLGFLCACGGAAEPDAHPAAPAGDVTGQVEAPMNNPGASGYTLRWKDEFSSGVVNTGEWNYRNELRIEGNLRPGHVRVTASDAEGLPDGALTLDLRVEEDRYIDNGEAFYSEQGSGWFTSSAPGVTGSSTRASCAGDKPRARWTLPAGSSGRYRIFFAKVVHPTSDASAQVNVYRVGQAEPIARITVNLTNGATGWVDLGLHDLTSGMGDYVEIVQGATSPSNACIRADTVRFLRLGGGGLIGKREYRYGYFEARLKTYAASGWHHAFWLQPTGNGSNVYLPGSSSPFAPNDRTEIDIIEVEGNNTFNGYHALHFWDLPDKRKNDTWWQTPASPLGFDTAAGYHRYGVEWTESALRWYVDGILKAERAFPPDTHIHNPVAFWLSEVPSQELAGPFDLSRLPGQMNFDYVAYYQRDAYLDNGEPGYSEAGGGWQDSTAQGFSYSTARVSCYSNASATWTVNLPKPGNYRVSLYRVVNANSDTGALVDIMTQTGAELRTVDFTQASGGNGWAELGTFGFGTTGQVRLRYRAGCIRADMVKFEFVN